ncbi:MAG: SGNH/GDSL hydrolase family protein [Anaerolineae bacterium]|nr:SGNH/GDSL hydrolase family protein [Anaerolineae bacterium]
MKHDFHFFIIVMLTIITTGAFLLGCQSTQSAQPAPDSDQNAGLVRLQQAMAKARRGEKIVIAGLGGSITQGDSAHADKRYIAQVYEWWDEKYPGRVTLVNAGLGATGSGLGMLRIEKDLLKENPDLVMVDFSVNDLGMPGRQETLEGVVRKILSSPNQPAIILVHFAVKSGNTTQADFEPLAEHYRIAQVSYRDRIAQLIDTDQTTLDDVYADDTHPNDLGHTYAADFIKEYLDSVYESLPANDADIPTVAGIPAPLYADTFQYTQVYNRRNFTPIIEGSWEIGYFNRRTGEGWVGEQVGDELIFEGLQGTAFGIILRKEGDVNFGMAEVWVDDGEPIKVDAFMPSSAGWYGPAAQFHLVAKDLPLAAHTLHIRIIDEKNPETGDNTNHIVEVANVFAAGVPLDE